VSQASEIIRSHLDDPAPSTRVDPLCFFVRGWLWLEERQSSIVAVEAWAGAALLGATKALYVRPDVNTAHWLPPETRTGFELFAHHPKAAAGKSFDLEIRARRADGLSSSLIFITTVATIARDYRTNHFGVLLQRETTAIQRHDNIFAVGPSQSEGSGELAHLLRRYLGPPPQRLLDVGCGFGSYGRGLLADGYDWLGVEVNAADCAELARLGLPHQQVDGRTLPFASDRFDAALCLEVLEHIEEPRAFLAEVSRVAARRLIVSVPNCELLGYLWDHLATPWHMLEATHTNFFTRWSLSALLREFYADVEVRFHTPYPLRTIEGTPLHYNLLAIATTPKA
jgi:SAM-dependent methyltransferase